MVEDDCTLGPVPIPGGVEFRRELDEAEASVIGDFNEWTPGRHHVNATPNARAWRWCKCHGSGTHQYMVHESGRDPVADIHCSKLERSSTECQFQLLR